MLYAHLCTNPFSRSLKRAPPQQWMKNHESSPFRRPSINSASTRSGTQRSLSETESVCKTPTYSPKSPGDFPNTHQTSQPVLVLRKAQIIYPGRPRDKDSHFVKTRTPLTQPHDPQQGFFFPPSAMPTYWSIWPQITLVRYSKRQYTTYGSLFDFERGVVSIYAHSLLIALHGNMGFSETRHNFLRPEIIRSRGLPLLTAWLPW